MGWTSTGDPYAHVGDSTLGFDSEEAAKSFAERHGWDYVVCIICFLYAALNEFPCLLTSIYFVVFPSLCLTFMQLSSLCPSYF